MTAFPWMAIGQMGEGLGQNMQQSDNKFASGAGQSMSGAFNPAKAFTQSIGRGDKWYESILAGTGLGAGLVGNKNKGKNALAETDPTQIAMLNEINAKRKALAQGTDTQYQLSQDIANRGLAQTQQNVLKSGGDIGSIMTGLGGAQRNAGDVNVQAMLPLLQKQDAYTTMASNLTDAIAQRKFEVQQLVRMQQMKEAASKQQANSQNMMATGAYLMGQLGNKTGDTTYRGASTPNTSNINIGNMNSGTPINTTTTIPSYWGSNTTDPSLQNTERNPNLWLANK